MIRVYRHNEIDKTWWDAALDACPQRNWYARSAVLDSAVPGWEALVDERTGAIMPLPVNSKWGFRYLYQPLGVQCLGVFAPVPSAPLVGHMLAHVPQNIKLWDINLVGSVCTGQPTDVVLQERTNMVLDLDKPLDVLRAGYGQSHRRGLRKFSSAQGPEEMPIEEFLAVIRNSEQIKQWRVDTRQWEAFARLVRTSAQRGEGQAKGIRGASGWESCGYFVCWQGTLIFLKGIGTEAGRSTFAMHRLLDAMIAEFHGRCSCLDLAGGENLAMRRFYAGFGARPILYLHARVNRLPQPLRWYKQRNDGV